MSDDGGLRVYVVESDGSLTECTVYVVESGGTLTTVADVGTP